MQDISAKEMKGHNILALERFMDSTRHMIEFVVRKESAYGRVGDEIRLFLSDEAYQQALFSQNQKEIKIKRYAHVIEGHILYQNLKKKGRA